MILNYKEIVELFSHEGREFYLFISRSAGYHPHSLKLFKQAFAHRSVSRTDNNERLEFLGDAVIETVVSHVLCDVFPDWREGKLSKLRSKLVCRQRLNAIATELDFLPHIKTVTRKTLQTSHIPGDVVEAFVAAIYLDGGMKKADAFVRRHIADSAHIAEATAETESTNFKSELINIAGRNATEVFFVTRYLDERNHAALPDNDNFISTVRINDSDVAEATGQSKKLAEQRAARKALEIVNASADFWQRNTPADTPVDTPTDEPSTTSELDLN